MLLTDTYRPINVGFGQDVLAVAFVQRAMALPSGEFRPERDLPDRIASWFGIFPIWVPGLYASFAYSLWRIRRESLRVAGRDSPLPGPISLG